MINQIKSILKINFINKIIISNKIYNKKYKQEKILENNKII